MAGTFAADLQKFGAKVQRRALDVARESIQDVIDDAQTPKAKGGRMPVDTGFLRNSLASGLNGSFGPPSENSYTLTIGELDLGDVARFAWTAEYAIFQELGTSKQPGNHFVRVAAAKWPQFVEANARRIR
jgi:HK97 gp10 family phage protein